MKNKFVYTLIVFCLGFGSPAWSAEETADSTLLGTLFNATMFQPNSSDSLTSVSYTHLTLPTNSLV